MIPPSLLHGYAPPAGVYDEAVVAASELRDYWRPVVGALDALGRTELERRWAQAQRLVHEHGLVYIAHGDPADRTRPWDLDAIPMLISADEWREVSTALVQRAQLLNLTLADLYGPQRLLSDGVLPAELVFSHPGFERPFRGQNVPGDCYLHCYAADLARAPDGQWWVVADRTDAPLGVGYALENRIVISRMLPKLIHNCHVERLAPFFIALRETLYEQARTHRDNPRIVLLSDGPASPSYFEDVYLARYLGYTLVEGADLAVRDNRVLLKTLAGLLPVDVVFRRLSDAHGDPLEQGRQSVVGVPGLLQAVRAGNVVVANALGSSLVESPAFIPFLPALARELLGAELLLPSVATWWCGQTSGRQYVRGHLDELRVWPAYRVGRQEPQLADLDGVQPARHYAEALEHKPAMMVGREQVRRSSVPIWADGSQGSAHVALRVFLIISKGSYQVLPGGLVRFSSRPGRLDQSILAGEGSKDTWVLSDGPVQQITLLEPSGHSVELRRVGTELPSRVADSLFWLGRHIERADGMVRLLRPILARLTSESEWEAMPELDALVRALAAQGQIEPGFAVDGIKQLLPTIEHGLAAAVLDENQSGNLRSTVVSMFRNASLVRDRMSMDGFRILTRIDEQMRILAESRSVGPSDLLEMLNSMVINLAAFSGVAGESMTRTSVWRFLEIGRRLERALHIIGLVRHALSAVVETETPIYEAALEIMDSTMTYRSRYHANPQLIPLLDLLLTDESNPRSLAFQLVTLAEHVDQLPRTAAETVRGPEQRIALSVLNSVRLADLASLCEPRNGERFKLDRMLARVAEQLPKLSDLINHKYLVHAGVPRQLSRGGA